MSVLELAPRRRQAWPAEIDLRLRLLVARGMALALIAAELGRTQSAVANRMSALGLSIRRARRQLWRNERNRRAEQLDPVARALVWLVAGGHALEWIYPDKIRVDGMVAPVTYAVRLANRAGADIPYPGARERAA